MDCKIKHLNVKIDNRGWLAELIRSEDVGKSSFGQVLVTTALPGKTKGGHYHKRKTEWYCVIKGSALLSLTDMKTGKNYEIKMGTDNMVQVKIPPYYFHTIENIGDEEIYLIAYSSQVFDPNDPDTFTN